MLRPLFFFNATATTEIYTFPYTTLFRSKALRLLRLPREVGLHPEDGKPILAGIGKYGPFVLHEKTYAKDRKSTCLNSSHPSISYAVFCLKKKNDHAVGTHLAPSPS